MEGYDESSVSDNECKTSILLAFLSTCVRAVILGEMKHAISFATSNHSL